MERQTGQHLQKKCKDSRGSVKAAAIFVNGLYPKTKLGFYKKLCRGKYKIAANGGYKFFELSKMTPDLIIGDFDSLNKTSLAKLGKRTKVISHPVKKDKADSELALEYCLRQKFKRIDIVMPQLGEPDHFMGLISLLANPKVKTVKVRIINHMFEIELVANERITYSGCAGELLSVKAVCEPIKLTCTGTEYDTKDLIVQPWETRALRNRIRLSNATVAIKGRALVFHYWAK